MSPGELLATVLQTPVLGPHTNIPVCEMQGDGGVPPWRERRQADAFTQFSASLIVSGGGDIYRGDEVRGHPLQSDLHVECKIIIS